MMDTIVSSLSIGDFFFYFVGDSAKNIQLLEKKKKRLDDDVEKYRKRLHDAEKCLKVGIFSIFFFFFEIKIH